MVSMELKGGGGFKIYPNEVQCLFVKIMMDMTGKNRSRLYSEAMAALIEQNKGRIQDYMSSKKEKPGDV